MPTAHAQTCWIVSLNLLDTVQQVYFMEENFRDWLALAYFANKIFMDCLYVSHTLNERPLNERQRARHAHAKYSQIIFSRIGTDPRNLQKNSPTK